MLLELLLSYCSGGETGSVNGQNCTAWPGCDHCPRGPGRVSTGHRPRHARWWPLSQDVTPRVLATLRLLSNESWALGSAVKWSGWGAARAQGSGETNLTRPAPASTQHCSPAQRAMGAHLPGTGCRRMGGGRRLPDAVAAGHWVWTTRTSVLAGLQRRLTDS